MAKHIHIHLPARIAGKGRDAGEFEESKHPRAANGQFGSGGGGGGGGAKPAAKKSSSSAPKPPDLPGPKSQAAIKAIQAAAAKGDWRAVANVSTLGTHSHVTRYKEAMQEHLQAGGKALSEAVAPKSSSTGGWSHTKNEAASQAAEKAMEDAWDDESGKGHEKAIVAIKHAIQVTEQGIREGSPKYAPDRKQEVERLKKRLADHEKHAKS